MFTVSFLLHSSSFSKEFATDLRKFSFRLYRILRKIRLKEKKTQLLTAVLNSLPVCRWKQSFPIKQTVEDSYQYKIVINTKSYKISMRVLQSTGTNFTKNRCMYYKIPIRVLQNTDASIDVRIDNRDVPRFRYRYQFR